MVDVLNVAPDIVKFGILIGSLIIVLFVVLRSESVRRQLKKVVLFFLVLTGLGLGYYFLTGTSPTEIPASIDHFFNGPQAPAEKGSKKYYREPEERHRELLTE